MYPKQEVVAMLLAGGQGSRLGVLTQKLAKAAVPFGGKYRIIDFPLSNCVNSGIEAVGVLTQYQPLVLNEYIGSGQPWDLDGMNSGVSVLSPYQQIKGTDWYTGTANAIYQNISYIDRYNPDYVVILSGDHIYKMDYSKMIAFHKENNADCTIAVIDVPLAEASRFGIMNTNPDGSIYEFEEKPKHPKSTNASMGIYVFSWDKLRKYLIEDETEEGSEHDFGKGNKTADMGGRIELRNVNFSFDRTKRVLKDINLTIEPGDIVGIVGTTVDPALVAANPSMMVFISALATARVIIESSVGWDHLERSGKSIRLMLLNSYTEPTISPKIAPSIFLTS